uniref:DLH domain-containing protein n=1 Tax=Steinernema glaseri TaxID=37863 RepID=A0A1I7ZLD7_9BILA
MVVKSTVEYQIGENVFEGVLCVPENPKKEKLPAVLVLHAFYGCVEFEIKKAEKLAELGYVAFAADVYGKGKRGTNVQENFALLKPLIADRCGELQRRLKGAFDYVAALDNVDTQQVPVEHKVAIIHRTLSNPHLG